MTTKYISLEKHRIFSACRQFRELTQLLETTTGTQHRNVRKDYKIINLDYFDVSEITITNLLYVEKEFELPDMEITALVFLAINWRKYGKNLN